MCTENCPQFIQNCSEIIAATEWALHGQMYDAVLLHINTHLVRLNINY